ncbi:NAD(P)-binding protein [Thozetella sp. PMI_491]|nr:NAD(P)-binding protein [Thozetella sp. PMI_491]
MAPRLGQKTVLITGCTPGGIGHALALEFHAKGLFVIPTARRLEVLTDLVERGMTAVQLDVTNAESIQAAYHEVAEITGGKLDILVNNAGRTHTHPALDLDIDDVRETFETNVFGVMAMCKAFAPQLIEAKGLIINIASLAALTPYLFGSAYSASKGAVISYSRALRIDLQPFGVRVMVGMVGTVKSDITNKAIRTLPADSLYQCVKDIFQWRLNFSQGTATVPTDVFAKHMVAKTLAPEVPSFLRRWIGRPDWFWGGGMAGIMWLGHTIGEWLPEAVCYRLFRVPEITRALKTEEAKKLR